jgi:hypothetical protein
MPEKRTMKEAAKLKRQHKAPTTQAGPFVEEEIRHVRQGKHGARSAKQAIAIGLSKAREAGVDLPPPKKGAAKASTRASAKRASARSRSSAKPSPKRSQAAKKALKREGRSAASRKALSRQAKAAAKKR